MAMADPELLYVLFSGLLTVCLIYPPREFEGAGVTVPNIFGRFFPNEFLYFVQHHIFRTTFTLVIYPSLPLFFTLLGYLKFAEAAATTVPWSLGIALSLLPPTIALCTAFHWHQNNWDQHPIVKGLRSHGNPTQLAEQINAEYRSPERIELKLNSVSSLVITEHWIIKTLPFVIKIVNLGDTEVVADQSDFHEVNEFGREAVQYLNVRVSPQNPAKRGFQVRLRATDFREIQEKLTRRIVLAPNVRLQPSLMERFIAAFEEIVDQNPKYLLQEAQDIHESCFACMTARPNIKIHKNCLDVDGDGNELPEDQRCGNCACRPMWCSGCLARWFAARQDSHHETWIEKKSPCPMCRTKFCILDVSLIDRRRRNAQ